VASDSQRRIVAVDAMGGDFGPEVVVPGAVAALVASPHLVLALYGDESAIQDQLARLETPASPVNVVPCSQNITMSESPAAAIRGKPDSPIVRAITDHRDGQVDAVVSAGSTGAMVAASLVILGRLPSVDRPAIGTLVPTLDSHLLLLDAGANVQCTPKHLLRFAQMGDLFCREMLGLATPRIGLLNIGQEESKGNELTVAAHRLLREAELDFHGNVEPNQLLLGVADVVVTDGFCGNLTLKQIEGFGRFLEGLARSETLPEKERATLLPALKLLQERFSYEAYGGALLLGIAGVSIISHGRSSSQAITGAVVNACRQADLDIPAKLQAALGG